MKVIAPNLSDDFTREFVSLADAWATFVNARYSALLDPKRFRPDPPTGMRDLVRDRKTGNMVPAAREPIAHSGSIDWTRARMPVEAFRVEIACQCVAFDLAQPGAVNECAFENWWWDCREHFWEIYPAADSDRTDGGALSWDALKPALAFERPIWFRREAFAAIMEKLSRREARREDLPSPTNPNETCKPADSSPTPAPRAKKSAAKLDKDVALLQKHFPVGRPIDKTDADVRSFIDEQEGRYIPETSYKRAKKRAWGN